MENDPEEDNKTRKEREKARATPEKKKKSDMMQLILVELFHISAKSYLLKQQKKLV